MILCFVFRETLLAKKQELTNHNFRHGINVGESLQTAPLTRPDLTSKTSVQEDDLEARLRNLG